MNKKIFENTQDFEKILETQFSISNLENLSKNICRKTYIITKDNNKYFLKINNSKTKKEFELIKNTIELLNKNNFSTAKLIYSKYENNCSYFLFEYLENIKNQNNNLEDIIQLSIKFYEITKNIQNEKQENQILKEIKLHLDKLPKIHLKILQNIITQLKKQEKQNHLIIVDINPNNLIYSSNKTYLIDFDEITFSEIEYDIAQIFLNFIINENSSYTLEKNIEKLKHIISKFNIITTLNNEKILNYLIISMYHDLLKYENNIKIQSDIFKKIVFILNNTKVILKQLNLK